MEQILKLEETDDITSIKSRIDFALRPPGPPAQGTDRSKANRFLLIVPRKNKALQSLVNMKLLARGVKRWAVEMAIVSDHPTVRDFAKEAGVKAFASLSSAKLAGWITSTAPVISPTETLPPTVDQVATGQKALPPAPKERVKHKKYVVIRGSGRINIFQQLGALGLVLMLALALVLGVIFLLPQATVTLTPVAQPVEASLVVKADPTVESLDFSSLTFPARTAQVELALFGEIETIETEDAPVGRATGTVTFINRTEEAHLIPISTTLSASTGTPIEFKTAVTTVVPAGIGATTTPTLVIAAEPGPTGNVGPGRINRFAEPTYDLLARVINEQALEGGTVEPAKVVVQDDKERLQAYLRQRIQQEGLTRLQESLGEQEFIAPETLQVIVLDIKYREFAGDFSETFGGEMQAVVRGTVVGGYNANRLALAALEAQVPPGFELSTRGLNFAAGEVLDISDQTVTFRIFAEGLAVPVIDIHEVAKEITWLPVGEAQSTLNQHYKLATVPGVELKPDWFFEQVGRLPYSSLRIHVVVKDAVTLIAEGG